MKTAAIICEYNPFHKGHMHHIAETKEYVCRHTGEECAILCVMSGNFVQRGDLAVCDKFSRAEMAVRCGADLVIELPTPYAMATAEVFAAGAVELIRKTNIAQYLSFGCEAGEITPLYETAKLLLSDEFSAAVKEMLTQGISFAAARQKAAEHLAPQISGILDKPNNTLAVEYLKAIISQNARLQPIAIPRSGQGHDDTSAWAEEEYVCASSIRKALSENKPAKAASMMPPDAADVLLRQIRCGCAPVFFEQIEPAMLSYLRRLSPSDLAKLPDVSEGLENRLAEAVRTATTFDDLCAAAKSKRYSYARIRRLFFAAFLDMNKKLYSEIPYARVLAFSDIGRGMIKEIDASLPVLTKSSAVNQLDEQAKKMFQFEAKCTDQYTLALPGYAQRRTGTEWITSPRYILRLRSE